MLDALLQLIAPIKCVICSKKLTLCCQEHLEVQIRSESIAGVLGYSALEFTDDTGKVFSAYKDRSITAISKPLGKVLAELCQLEVWQAADLVLFPPSSKAAFRRRGFVPVQLLLRASRQKLRARSFVAVRRIADQRLLGSEQRRQNLDGALAISGVSGKKVVLFDDVMTSSATVQEMIRAAKKAGASVSGFCVLARRISETSSESFKKA